jgi:hypothetical protein
VATIIRFRIITGDVQCNLFSPLIYRLTNSTTKSRIPQEKQRHNLIIGTYSSTYKRA